MKSYRKSEISFLSADEKHTIFGEIYEPVSGQVRGVVQLAHGMTDYVARYEWLAGALTARGYVFAGHCHLGHGKSAGREEDLGYFAKKNGVTFLLKDMHRMNKLLRAAYPGKPQIVLGHSMGSFIARLFVAAHPHSMDACVILGTGGKNPLQPMGVALCSLLALFCGDRHRSRFVSGMAFGSYNKRFDPAEGATAWLTRDRERVKTYKTDPYCSVTFTLSAYRDLFRMLGACNSGRWYKEYPKNMPTLLMSGDMDPVGNYGKGVTEVYRRLLLAGCSNVSMQLYEGARHELFNEINREEFAEDLCRFLESVTG
ncbi:MAG: alpha/beta fold hydrolase [Clostridia bacterium]|nr:alpha/beta fold hydrolase [Clostridia bacterium]